MERTMIGDLRGAIGQTVKIQGWLQTLRDQKKMQFLVIRDTSGAAQVVLEKQAHPELAERISRLSVEAALTLTGRVIDNPVVKLGGLEVQLESLVVEGESEPQLPLDPFAEVLPAIDYPHGLALSGSAPAGKPAAVPGCHAGRDGHARVLGEGALYRDPHAQADGLTLRKRGRAVRAALFRDQSLPGPVAAVL